jgi:predicted MFS family arabinose efflux permease
VLVQRVSGSYAVAGAAIGAHAAAIAVSAPWRGRLLDRRGPRAVVPLLALANGAAIAALPLAARAGSGWPLVAMAGLAGLTPASFAAAMRVEWQALLGRASPLLERAYALETSLQISAFVFGALAAAAGIAVLGASGTLLVCAALTAAGGFAFAAAARSPGSAPAPGTRRSPIRRPGVRTLVVATALADVGLGTVDVAVIAFADERGQAWVAGILLAVVTLSSAVGGLAYGARDWRAPAARRLVWVFVAMAVTLALLATAGSIVVLGALLVLAGPPSAAQWATVSMVLDRVTPPGTDAEAFNWLSTANAAGFALGGLVAGVAVELGGAEAAFVFGALGAAAAGAVVAARRATLAVTPR